MDNKLIQFLQMSTESSPVWLDDGNTIAYIRHDNTGSHIWQMDLTTGEKLCRTTEDTRIWTIKSVPATGDIYYATDSTGSECERLYRLSPGQTNGSEIAGDPNTRYFLGGIMPDYNIIAYT